MGILSRRKRGGVWPGNIPHILPITFPRSAATYTELDRKSPSIIRLRERRASSRETHRSSVGCAAMSAWGKIPEAEGFLKQRSSRRSGMSDRKSAAPSGLFCQETLLLQLFSPLSSALCDPTCPIGRQDAVVGMDIAVGPGSMDINLPLSDSTSVYWHCLLFNLLL